MPDRDSTRPTADAPQSATPDRDDQRDPQKVAEGRDDDPFQSHSESSYRAVSAVEPEPLLSVDQVARWLGKPKATLYAWRSRGQGPPGIRVGNALRYRRVDVERWLDEHTDQASNPSGDSNGPTATAHRHMGKDPAQAMGS